MKGLILQRGSLSSEKYVISRSVFNRVLEPLNYLVENIRKDVCLSVMDVQDCDGIELDGFDFAVFCKHNTEASVRLHNKLIELNVKVIYDFDDLIYKFTEDSIAYSHMDKVENIRFHLENSSHVVFSNESLRSITEKDFSVKRSSIIETGINVEKYSNPKYEPNKAGVLFTNGDIIKLEHFRESFYEVFNRFLGENKRLAFDVFGDTESYLESFKRYNFLGSLQWDEHKKYLMENQYLMAIVPLGSTEESLTHQNFSVCKTPIKFYEYGAMSIPAIFSNAKIYSEVVENKVTGLLVPNTTEDWYEALTQLSKDQVLREKLARNSFEKVNECHHIKFAARKWSTLLTK